MPLTVQLTLAPLSYLTLTLVLRRSLSHSLSSEVSGSRCSSHDDTWALSCRPSLRLFLQFYKDFWTSEKPTHVRVSSAPEEDCHNEIKANPTLLFYGLSFTHVIGSLRPFKPGKKCKIGTIYFAL